MAAETAGAILLAAEHEAAGEDGDCLLGAQASPVLRVRVELFLDLICGHLSTHDRQSALPVRTLPVPSAIQVQVDRTSN